MNIDNSPEHQGNDPDKSARKRTSIAFSERSHEALVAAMDRERLTMTEAVNAALPVYNRLSQLVRGGGTITLTDVSGRISDLEVFL